MLQFVFGKPATGKTYYLFQNLKKCVREGKQAVFIVPEQFTFETEKAVLYELGDSLSSNVTVLSFSRLYDELGRIKGGISARILNDSDRVIFMKMALSKSAGDLRIWSKYAKSVNFAKTILETVSEFKMNSVTADDLKLYSKTAKTDYLSNKLHDFSLVFENYNLLLSEKFLDPDDKLKKVCDFLKGTEYFSGKTVFFDSFKGFTGQQFKIIDIILQKAENVCFAMTDNKEVKGEYSLFYNIRKAVSKIEASAKRHGITVSEPIYLTETHYNCEIMNNIEELLSVGKTEKPQNISGLTVCKAETPFDEAEFVARNMRRLVREKGYRYSDFVIVARDTEKYKTAVNSACRKNKISCFSDNKISLSNFPISVAVRSLISAISLSSEDIINFHKSGVSILTEDEIYALESYIHIWNISGPMWQQEWDMDPRGLVTDGDLKEEIKSEIAEINAIREKAIAPITEFKDNFSGDARRMATAIFNILKNCDFAEKMSDLRKRFKDFNSDYYADAIKQSYEQYMSILDSIVRCFGDAKIKPSEFSEALNLAVSLSYIGVIPQTLDEVMFGSADRIRPSRPKVAFIMGANLGEFPKTVSNSGIFTLNERKILAENGFDIPNNTIDLSIDEDFLVYSNLCCATDEIYISFSEMSVSGEKSEPSNFVTRISEKLNCTIAEFPQKEDITLLPETDDTLFSEYCRVLRNNQSVANSYESVLQNTKYGTRIESVRDGKVLKTETLSPKTAEKLFGKRMKISSSRLDTFSRCHFSYFCKYGLNAKSISAADFNSLQRGTIVHYCLERLITENKDKFNELTENDLQTLTESYLDDYLKGVKGFSSVTDERLLFIKSRILRSLKDVVIYIAAEIKQSDFTPVACELGIGDKKTDIKVSFQFDGGELYLDGSVDRVDEYKGYVRIIDYKTGSRDFKLPDILFGLNMQMLLYLYSVTRGNGKPDSSAAGILYMPSKRDIYGKGRTMSGLILADKEISKAMDKEGEGRFIPKLFLNKDGAISAKNDCYISADEFTAIFDHIERIMRKTGNSILSGDISVLPLNGRESDACEYCDFKKVCGIEDNEIRKVERLSKAKVMEILSEGGKKQNGDI